MDRSALLAAWQQEEQAPFAGWDFSYLAGRMLEDQPPWSYADEAAARLRAATAALDLGTGGGERLLALRPHWPPVVAATEGYAPNLALATTRLAPLGVTVAQAETDESTILPFAAGSFDLVLSRHSSFNAAEVARVLAPGGTFYTQQVHGLSAADLIAAFDTAPQWPYATPAYFSAKLAAAGLVLSPPQEWQGHLRFADVGALVYYLKAVPWLVTGFSVATHADALFTLQAQQEAGHPLLFTTRLYTLTARKPG
jgi:SAM-dependent methyltransferase